MINTLNNASRPLPSLTYTRQSTPKLATIGSMFVHTMYGLPTFQLLTLAGFILLVLALTSLKCIKSKRENVNVSRGETPTQNPYTSIIAVANSDWKNVDPLGLRPFKPQYHLTMGLENMTINELVEVDKTYESRIHLRRQIMRDHPSTFDHRPGSEAAVYELYEWMTTLYLPRRFPSMYKLDTGEKADHLRNLVTNESIPLRPESARDAMHTLGCHVDTDFLILLPSAKDGVYCLEAFVTTFPSGFSTLAKLGKTLAEIHAPVPKYAAKLGKSMDRFFANLPVGKVVKRANWTVTTNDILYAEKGTHLYADDDHANHDDAGLESEATGQGLGDPNLSGREDIERQKAQVNVAECRLRCERQTLHRLPNSQALVFAFKTYQYRLEEVKAEGSGEALASAIEGFGKGSVPEMEFYKKGIVWGDKVKEFLRR